MDLLYFKSTHVFRDCPDIKFMERGVARVRDLEISQITRRRYTLLRSSSNYHYYNTNPFLHSLSGSVWTAFTDFGLGPNLVGTGVCLFWFILYIFLFLVTCSMADHSVIRFSFHIKNSLYLIVSNWGSKIRQAMGLP